MDCTTSRLDRYIKRVYGKLIPQSMIEKALRNKDILINGQRAKSSDKVNPGDEVFVHPNVCRMFASVYCNESKKPVKDYSKYTTKFKELIIYEDEDIIIINKPSGLAVQLGSKTNLAVDVMAKAYNPEARLVHRIDKETSGIAILAKNLETSRYMLHIFQNKLIQKKYLAVVCEKIQQMSWKVEKPLLKEKDKVVVDFEKGQKAITEFKVIKNISSSKTLIEATPHTGRTHQIRVHLASLNLQILGDQKYGGKREDHLYLHAYSIRFKTRKNKDLFVKAKPPSYFEKL